MRAFFVSSAMVRQLFIWCVCFFALESALAQAHASASEVGAAAADSAAIHVQMPEVVVSATRTRLRLEDAPSAVTVIGRRELETNSGQRLSSILQGLPGVSVRDLGGLHGIKTISLRGTSSVHTLFLLGGLRLNSPQNGLVDLGLLTGDAFETIEIVRGAQSALYGADAIGGVVQLTARRASDSLRLALAGEVGSFGLFSSRASASWGLGKLSVAAGLGYEQSDGDYEFVGSVQGREATLERQGASSRYGTGFLHLAFPVSGGTHASFFTNLSAADRGSPGPYTGAPARSARLNDRIVQSTAQVVTSLASLGTLSASAGYLGSVQRYRDETSGEGLDERYDNSSVMASAQWDVPLSSWMLGVASAEIAQDRTQASQLADGALRSRWALTLGSELVVSDALQLFPRVSLYPALRYDEFSDLGVRWSPRLGLNVWLTQDGAFRLRGSAGTSFRAPNFNELYWVDGGNADLKAESAVSLDAGIAVAFEASGSHQIDLGIFRTTMKDRITGWPPVNLARSNLSGIELGWRWGLFSERLYTTLSASYTRAANETEPYAGSQLPFVPLLDGRASLGGRLGALRLEASLFAMSRRYTTLDNSDALSADAFAVLSLWAEYPMRLSMTRITLRLSLENLLNADYEIVPSYPMPLRSGRFGVRIDL